jgi:hypothetical protein
VNLKPEDTVFWLDRTGKGQFGVLKFRGWVRITEPFPEGFNDSEEVKDNAIKWIILGDDGQIYIVEEVRIKKSVWI